MGLSEIVAEERKYLTNLGYKLAELQSMTQGQMALEQIYAGFFSAYQKGLQALASFEQDMGNIERAINTGQLQQDHVVMLQRAGVEQARWLGAMNLVACMRCLDRPSEAFRSELRRQQKAIIGSLQRILADKTRDTSDLTHDLKFIGELLCSFELPTPEQPKGGLMKFITPTTLAMTGVGLITGFGIKALLEYRAQKKAEAEKETKRLENKAASTSKASKKKATSNPILQSLRKNVSQQEEEIEEEVDEDDQEEMDAEQLEALINFLEQEEEEDLFEARKENEDADEEDGEDAESEEEEEEEEEEVD